jgi:hypothetical protein
VVYGAGFCIGWTAVEGAQGENGCLAGSVGALMVGRLEVGTGVLVGVPDWVVMAGWDGGYCSPYDYFVYIITE